MVTLYCLKVKRLNTKFFHIGGFVQNQNIKGSDFRIIHLNLCLVSPSFLYCLSFLLGKQ